MRLKKSSPYISISVLDTHLRTPKVKKKRLLFYMLTHTSRFVNTLLTLRVLEFANKLLTLRVLGFADKVLTLRVLGFADKVLTLRVLGLAKRVLTFGL